LTQTSLVLAAVELGHGVYRKLYTLIGVNVQKSLRTTGVDSWSTLGAMLTALRAHRVVLNKT